MNEATAVWHMTKATDEQLPLLNEMYEEAARWQAEQSPVHWPLACKENWSEDIARGYLYLLMHAVTGEVAGMAILYPEPEPFDRAIWPDPDASAAYLHKLIVRRAWEGRQLGAVVLDWALAESGNKGKRYLRLDCMGDNVGLNRYYPRMGFAYCGRKEGNGWSACLYQKETG